MSTADPDVSPAPPQVFFSYSHDSDAHADRVLALSNRLRADGIDAIVDQYEPFPKEGWILWMKKRLRAAQFVLVVCTETYRRRADGEEEPGVGLGATYESQLIQQLLYNTGGINEKFIPVLVDPSDRTHVPLELQRYNSFPVYTENGYEDLYRYLTNQPRTAKPEIGERRALPPRERRPDFRNIAWNVPERNAYFTGRERFLKTLHAALTSESTESVTQVITGLGGIGKTQAAIEYAHRHRYEYAAVLWTRADSRPAVTEGFVEIARALGLPEGEDPDQNRAVEAVKRRLETTDGWLLIFDSADTPELVQELLEEFRPENPRGRILLTSRVQDLGLLNIAPPLEIKEMTRAEARDFLLKRANREGAAPAEKAAAKELAGELGCLPLALEQAAAYIRTRQSRFQDYLASYRKRALRLLEKKTLPGNDYPHSVATTWDLNFSEVEKTPEAADLLRASAFLGSDGIPFELIVQGAAEFGSTVAAALADAEEDPLVFDETLEPLVRYSLIRRDNDVSTYSVHRLVQLVVRDRLDEPSRCRWAERAARAVNRAFPLTDEEFSNWEVCARLVLHALACAGFSDLWVPTCPGAAQALTSAAYYLMQRGQYADAERLLRQALQIQENGLGPSHPDTARTLNGLGWVSFEEARYDEAQQLHARALAIRESVLGPDHLDVAHSLNNLAAVYDRLGRYAEAESLYHRALTICEQRLEPDHHYVAACLNNLAIAAEQQGQFDRARDLYRRTLSIWEKKQGPERRALPASLNNLGRVCCRLARYDEAEALYRRALAVWEEMLGTDHPDIAQGLTNLALFQAEQGRLSEMEPLLRRALNIRRKALRPDHPDLVISLSNLAELYTLKERSDEAGPLLEEAIKIADQALPPEHPYTDEILKNYARWLRHANRLTEAEEVERRREGR